MKNEVFDTGVFLSVKLLSILYLMSTIIQDQLLDLGFNLFFLYVGLLGQIVATLVDVHRLSSNKNFELKVTWGQVINTVSQLLIAPILSFLITSTLFKTVTPSSIITAFAIGAFWEFAWRAIKRNVEKKFNDLDENK